MSGLLDWRFADKCHIQDLNAFVCTDFRPRPRERTWRTRHGWWEFEVQSCIRDLRPPYRGGAFLRVGYDGLGLAAACFVEELDGPDVVEMSLSAVAVRLRHKGGGYADEMFADALDVVTTRALAAEVPEVLLIGYIYEDNAPSQALCRRNGFVHTGDGGEGVQQWSRRLLTTADEDEAAHSNAPPRP